jgi:hypothetical protein
MVRAKDLVLSPRSRDWARTLRNRAKPETAASESNAFAPLNIALPRATAEVPDAPPFHAFRLDVRGITPSGNDGHDTAHRILRDLVRCARKSRNA